MDTEKIVQIILYVAFAMLILIAMVLALLIRKQNRLLREQLTTGVQRLLKEGPATAPQLARALARHEHEVRRYLISQEHAGAISSEWSTPVCGREPHDRAYALTGR